MRKLAFTLVPLLLLACGREPAAPSLPGISADRRAVIVRDLEDPVVGLYLGSCDGFDILGDWDGLIQINSYYDGAGNLVRQHVRYRGVGASRYYNSVNPSVEVAGGPGEIQNNFYNFWDTWMFSGVSWKVTLPGYGTIFFETGRTVIDITNWPAYTITHDAGLNQMNEADFAALCAVLTP